MVNQDHSLNSQASFHPVLERPVSEQEAEGFDLDALTPGTVLELQTGHHAYRLQNLGDGKALISGHPTYCPEPAEVQVHGSIWGAGLLKWRFVGKGMKLEFEHPVSGIIRTSRIREIREVRPSNAN